VIPPSDKSQLKADLDITWHTTNVEELLSNLGTSTENGISKAYAARRLQEDGPNALNPPKRNGTTFFRSYIRTFFSNLIQ
jgi:hypothetical protein